MTRWHAPATGSPWPPSSARGAARRDSPGPRWRWPPTASPRQRRGGCVEGAVYELAQEVLASGEPVLQRYGVSDDDAFAVGLTCGGIIDVFVEPVDATMFPELPDVVAAIRDHEPVAVATVIDGPGNIGAHLAVWAGPQRRQPRHGPARRRGHG